MPRARKIAEEDAVAAAMRLFWTVGYAGAGTRMIEERTGITRFTLQTGFGGKKALFLAALDLYASQTETLLFGPLEDGTLDDLVAWLRAPPVPPDLVTCTASGCLMVNSATEFGETDEDVSERTQRFFAMIEGTFEELLYRARSRGHLRTDVKMAEAASLLLATTLAGHVARAAGADGTAGAGIRAAAANLVESWRA